jgi:hypothetical protein
VLSAGTNARDYAGHLLELAYAVRSGRRPALAVSMAGSGQLEGRMLALLDAARNRAVPALRSHLIGICVLLSFCSACRLRFQFGGAHRPCHRKARLGIRWSDGWSKCAGGDMCSGSERA